MCSYPYGEFGLVSAQVTGPAEGIHCPWQCIFLSAVRCLPELVASLKCLFKHFQGEVGGQEPVVLGMGDVQICDRSQESVLSPRLAACLLQLVTAGGLPGC